jgi:hypothetical protein
MGIACCVHNSTTYPVKTDDEIVVATEQEVRLEQIKLAALRKEDEIKAQARAIPTMRQMVAQAPPMTVSRDALPQARAFLPPTPLVNVTFRGLSDIEKISKRI